MRKVNIALSLGFILLLALTFVPHLRKTVLIILIIAAVCYVLTKLILSAKHKKELKNHINSIPQSSTAQQTQKNYSLKNSLITQTEKPYFETIKKIVEPQYIIQPQINLASIIDKKSADRFRNELFRNIDFGIFNQNYKPLVLIEINDQSHSTPERKERDKKVKDICADANIPLIVLWTNFGVNKEYIEKRLSEHLTLIDASTENQDKQNLQTLGEQK